MTTTISPERKELTSAGRQVPALVRASSILDELARDGRPKGVSELARLLGLPKSSIHGLCQTMADLGILARLSANQFGLGPHVLSWANAFQSQSSLTLEFQRLCAETRLLEGETLNLTVMSGSSVLYVGCRAGASPLGVSFRVGMSLPAVFTATGKAMMSTFPDEQVRAMFGRHLPAPVTRTSVPILEALRQEHTNTRRRGYSIDNGQLREGMFCVGAPVFDGSGPNAIAGLAVGLLSAEVRENSTEKIGRDLVSLANELSKRLGGGIRALAAREIQTDSLT